MERSDVSDGQVARTKVPCDGGKIRLSSAEASTSAASAFRLQSADATPLLFARAPVVQLPKNLAPENRTLLIARTDRKGGDRHALSIDDATAAAGFYDLAKRNLSLARGATYEASLGDRKLTFQIDANARSGPAPVVSRLLRFKHCSPSTTFRPSTGTICAPPTSSNLVCDLRHRTARSTCEQDRAPDHLQTRRDFASCGAARSPRMSSVSCLPHRCT
jgi:hypothetical protein